MSPLPERIVGEVSVNWPGRPQQLGLPHLFQQLISVNRERGYDLESWQLSRVGYVDTNSGENVINETIIATFLISRSQVLADDDGEKGVVKP